MGTHVVMGVKEVVGSPFLHHYITGKEKLGTRISTVVIIHRALSSLTGSPTSSKSQSRFPTLLHAY